MDEFLQQWRYTQRISPEQAAQLFGVSLKSYLKWESGKSSIPLRFYLKLSTVTGADLSTFLPEGLTVMITDDKTNTSIFQYKALELVKLLEENCRRLYRENEQLRAEIERLCY